MKILILGGTGAIGTPLIAILRQNQDIQICVTSRSEHSSEENVQYLKADVLNQSELENILIDRKSTRLNSSHQPQSRMPSSS